MKYIEFGIGNRWLVRTETEFADGSETERKGIEWPVRPESVYVRLWIGRQVYILSTKGGFSRKIKPRRTFKLILGVSSYEPHERLQAGK